MPRLTAVLCAGLLFFFASFATGAQPRPGAGPFPTTEKLLAWMNAYRLEPAPKRLPDAVKAMQRLGLLKDSDNSGLFVGFMAGVLGDNQLEAPKLAEKMFPMPPEDQGALIRAIAYSGIPDWKVLLASLSERMPARRKLIDTLIFGKSPPLMEAPLDSGPAAIDTLWGTYFATGRFEPVQRIFAALPWAAQKKELNRLTLGHMAKWTLATNASNEKGLLDYYRLAVKHQPKEIAAALKEVIAAAEDFETTRIRKAAVAAIEEFKIKGPQVEKSKWGWAAQAGQTALAVGCVVAGVTGHAELAVPCVVTGALSSVALKLVGGTQ